MGEEAFRRFAKAAIEAHSRTPIDERFWPAFASMLHYHAGGFDDTAHFHALARTIEGLDEQIGGGAHRVFCAKLHHHNRQRCIFRCKYGDLN